VLVFAVLAIVGPICVLSAQATRKVVEVRSARQLTVPRWLKAVPTKPGEEQILLQLGGKSESRDRDFDGEIELTLMLVRILKNAGPVTGESGEAGTGEAEEGPEMRSITEQRRAELNAGKTLPEFLERRGLRKDLVRNAGYFAKPLTDELEREFAVHEYASGQRGDRPLVLIRAFVVEDENEIFGLVATGVGVTAFAADIERIVRSLRPADPADLAGSGDDPYAGSSLRDVEKRRAVRAELAAGWRAHDTENYILVTNVEKQGIVDAVLVDLEIMRAAYFERFPPAEKADMSPVSTVRLCDGYDEYLRYAGKDMDGTGGYWSPLEEELVLFNPERKIPKARPWLKDVDPISTLYHEAMHQYFHYSNRQLAPGMWFNEGYGEVFAGAKVDRRKLVIADLKPDKDRLKMIKAELKRHGAPDMRMVMVQPRRDFYGEGVLINYANAWSICYFLELERRKPESRRNQAWADLPDVYLQHLREITERFRARFPENAPDDWIMGFAEEIQREAVEKALATIDERELEEAWLKEIGRWR
jgi:hypothetical protein